LRNLIVAPFLLKLEAYSYEPGPGFLLPSVVFSWFLNPDPIFHVGFDFFTNNTESS